MAAIIASNTQGKILVKTHNVEFELDFNEARQLAHELRTTEVWRQIRDREVGAS